MRMIRPIILGAALAGSLVAVPALGQAQPNTASPMPKSEAASRISQFGAQAVRDLRLARVEIFDGDKDRAAELVLAAKTWLQMAQRDAATSFTDVRPKARPGQVANDVRWVPVEAGIAVADDFVVTPERARHLAAANQHLQTGNHGKAMEEFRLAETDIALVRVLMPLEPTQRQVAKAETLMRAGKFYEANLALKAAQDGLVTDTEILAARPARS